MTLTAHYLTHATRTVTWVARVPSDARRDPVAIAVAEAVAEAERAEGEHIIVNTSSVSTRVARTFVEQHSAGQRISPVDSLRLEASRVLATLAHGEDLPATVMASADQASSVRAALAWSRYTARPVCHVLLTMDSDGYRPDLEDGSANAETPTDTEAGPAESSAATVTIAVSRIAARVEESG